MIGGRLERKSGNENRVVAGVDVGAATVKAAISGGDSPVLALGTRSANELAEQIKGKMIEVHTIGDAKEPRKALDAIEQGTMVGCRI
jgi:hypothetical protein